MKGFLLIGLLLLFNCSFAQVDTSPKNDSYPAPANLTSEQDHQNMMNQLGVKRLRTGPSGNEADPNHANYDESLANPYPNLPDIFTLNNGDKVSTPDAWWNKRRPEIIAGLESEMYGRLPAHIPVVNWTVKYTDKEFIGFYPVIAKQLVGHVDNAAYPLIDVNISATLVVPANAKGKVPVLMMFGRSGVPAPAQPSLEELEKINGAMKILLEKINPDLKAVFEKYPAYTPIAPQSFFGNFFPPKPGADPPAALQLIADGWGYLLIDPASIQADNGAGLTRGIIGLVNKGQPPLAGGLGSIACLGMGCFARIGLPGNRPRR